MSNESTQQKSNSNGLNLQTFVMVATLLTALILVSGTFLAIGEFKGVMTEKVSNIEKSVNTMTVDHEARIRTLERATK